MVFCASFHVTPCVVVAVQHYIEWIPILKNFIFCKLVNNKIIHIYVSTTSSCNCGLHSVCTFYFFHRFLKLSEIYLDLFQFLPGNNMLAGFNLKIKSVSFKNYEKDFWFSLTTLNSCKSLKLLHLTHTFI